MKRIESMHLFNEFYKDIERLMIKLEISGKITQDDLPSHFFDTMEISVRVHPFWQQRDYYEDEIEETYARFINLIRGKTLKMKSIRFFRKYILGNYNSKCKSYLNSIYKNSLELHQILAC